MLLRQPVHTLPERLARLIWSWALAWWRIVYLGAVVLVLVLSPSSYGRAGRGLMARRIYLETTPILVGFTVLAALLSLVITRIVVVTALSYGLSRYALEMVIRVLVLELIPLTAAMFVAMRCAIPSGSQLASLRLRGRLAALERVGADPVRMELLPRVVAAAFASVTLAALSCVVALSMSYLSVYGFNTAGLPSFTRMFGHVFSPEVTLVFALKTLFFSLAIAVIPMTAGLYDLGESERRSELGGLARMFAVLLLIEMVSLVGNYY
ncbi:MAG: ABC transporter permease [Burkholderiaceae bacterium]|jgi:phospholipid/cholesterol/gamma-HCH transport system permease protein|nr:ABC transporter permease [Burkholderiaceae bacterium]MCO5102891.1 ABC transporter permease [Burkholderiaceae bacterium]